MKRKYLNNNDCSSTTFSNNTKKRKILRNATKKNTLPSGKPQQTITKNNQKEEKHQSTEINFSGDTTPAEKELQEAQKARIERDKKLEWKDQFLFREDIKVVPERRNTDSQEQRISENNNNIINNNNNNNNNNNKLNINKYDDNRNEKVVNVFESDKIRNQQENKNNSNNNYTEGEKQFKLQDNNKVEIKQNLKFNAKQMVEEEVVYLKEAGDTAFKKGDYKQAVSNYNKAIKLDPNNFKVFSNRSAAYIKLKQYDKAGTDADQVIRLAPSFVRAYHRKGLSLFHQKKYEEAKKYFALGLEREPGNEDLSQAIRDCNIKIKQVRENFRKLKKVSSDFECVLCMKLLYEPVTTPCGHSYCKSCLLRALDHSSSCPMCRQVIHYTKEHSVSVVLKSIIQKNFPKEYEERRLEESEEHVQADDQMPLFLLNTCAFPGVSFPMHIFEPRYRLLVRRCLQGDKKFGLVPCTVDPNGEGRVHSTGTCLKINSVRTLEDGRSFIDCVGVKRFKILDSWSLDGYKVGKVQWIDDKERSREEEEKDKEIMEVIKKKLFELNRSEDQRLKQVGEFVRRYSNEIPRNSKEFSFWVSAYIPTVSWFKQELLDANTTGERLTKIDNLLNTLLEKR